jgi:hypothetical protein
MQCLNAAKAVLLLATGMAFAPLHTASAVETPMGFKVYDTDIVLDTDGTYVGTGHAEIYAKNDSAAQQVAQQEFPYSESLEDLEVVNAYTLKADGTKIPVAAGSIFTQTPKDAQNVPMDDRKQKLIVFPKVAAGDLVVYTIKVHARHAFFPGNFTLGDTMPRTVSIEQARTTIVAPKTMPLAVETHDMSFTKEEGEATTTYRWTYHAPDALSEDNSQLSAYDVNPRYFASSFKDYDELARVYASMTAPLIAVTPKIQAQADLLTAGITDRREQAEKIHQWVSSHITLADIDLGEVAVGTRSAETILADGYGDSNDHAVILAALLKAKGIDSDLVLANAGNAYTLPDVAVLGELKHVINWLPEFGLYDDTSFGVAPFGVVGPKEYGKPVVHAGVNGNALRRIPVMPAATGAASISVKTKSQLDLTGKLTGETETVASGPAITPLRIYGQEILSLGPENAAATQLQSLGYAGGTGTFDLASPDDPGQDYSVVGHFEVPPQPQYLSGAFQMPAGLELFSSPGDTLMGPLWNYKLTANDPTPCWSGHAEEELSLELPAGKHLVKLPSDIRIADKHVEFTAHWSMDGHTVAVKRDFKVTVDQALCAGDLRKEAARALAAIRDSYNMAQLSLADDSGT